MEEFTLTEEEKQLIINRRNLLKSRKERVITPVKKGQNQPQPPQQAAQARPDLYQPHNDLSRPHRGRLQPGHPVYWFEKEIFQQIGNVQHKKEHEKIAKLLKMPIQNKYRDRVYHALCHLDLLWAEGRLPVRYKVGYEKLKEENNIGDDNIHPSHKEPGVTYPIAQNKRPWNPEEFQDYDDKEMFEHACFRQPALKRA